MFNNTMGGLFAIFGFALLGGLYFLPPLELNLDTGVEENDFTRDLALELYMEFPWINLVFSPISIRSGLAAAYFGSNGQSEKELQTFFPSKQQQQQQLNDAYIAEYFASIFLEKNNSQLEFRNNIAVTRHTEEIYSDYEEIVQSFFQAEINAQQQHHYLHHYLHHQQQQQQHYHQQHHQQHYQEEQDQQHSVWIQTMVNWRTPAKWLYPFAKSRKIQSFFRIDKSTRVEAEIMEHETSHYIAYGNFPELDVRAIELPYLYSNLSMMVIVPNSNVNSLEMDALGSKFFNATSVHTLSEMMNMKLLMVKIPKFTISFDYLLNNALVNMGLTTVSNANMSKMFKTNKVSDKLYIQHMTSICVNELGTDAATAAADSSSNVTLKQRRPRQHQLHQSEVFVVNRPFYFIIKEPKVVYYVGRVLIV